MNCLLMGNDDQLAALQQSAPSVSWQVVATVAEAKAATADAFFYLENDAAAQDWAGFACPVFVNSAILGLPNGPFVGINGWPYFLQKAQWEVAGNIGQAAEAVLAILGKTAVPAPATPGLISARVLAMVINEAYFALADEVSSRADIDTAMKLGTNYPYGPFEWAALLGVHNIYQLLDHLAPTDGRCTPAPLLKAEALA